MQKICISYNDRKYLAFALLKEVKWEKLEVESTLNGRMPTVINEKCVLVLHQAKNVLTVAERGEHVMYSRIYIDIMHELGGTYALAKRFNESANCYKSLYEYFTFLLDDLDSDKEIIDKVICGNVEYPEYLGLNIDEKRELHNSLLHDYQFLLRRMIEISRTITSIQYQNFMEYAGEKLRLEKDIDYHLLLKSLKIVIAQVERGAEKSELIRRLRDLEDKIKEIRKSKILLNTDLQMLDPYHEIKQLLLDIEFDALRDYISFKNISHEKTEFHFNLQIFCLIIKNLIFNVKEAAQKYSLNNFKMEICFYETIDNHSRIVYIAMADNIPSYEQLKKSIEVLNQDNMNDSTTCRDKGHGLYHVKSMLHLNTLWRLQIMEKNDMTKILTIPIYEKLLWIEGTMVTYIIGKAGTGKSAFYEKELEKRVNRLYFATLWEDEQLTTQYFAIRKDEIRFGF